jgi:hypothetical protein
MSNQQKGYKRSWRNLLLDTNYQLVFTLFMVLSCALFMAGLGYLVMKEATIATTTAIDDVEVRQKMGIVEDAVAEKTIDHLNSRRHLLNWILIGLGLGLTGGLFVYGIKMTHKVAGPIFKIALYMDKVEKGKFDKVYNLRKGDQLVEFYESFKQVHDALRKRQERDVECLKEVIAVAEKAQLASQSTEVAGKLDELRALLKTKEATLG